MSECQPERQQAVDAIRNDYERVGFANHIRSYHSSRIRGEREADLDLYL